MQFRDDSIKGPAPLPPIPLIIPNPGIIPPEFTELEDEDEDEDKDREENNKNNKGPETTNEDGQKCGKISKFFNGFKKQKPALQREPALEEERDEDQEDKKKEEEEEEKNKKEEGEKAEEDEKQKSVDEDKKEEGDISDSNTIYINSTNETGEQEEKTKKKVSFFSRFSKENETTVEIIGEEPKGANGLMSFFQKNKNIDKDTESKADEEKIISLNDKGGDKHDNDDDDDDDMTDSGKNWLTKTTGKNRM